MKTTTEINALPYEPRTDHLTKVNLWKETLDVWNLLKDAGYDPADIGCSVITMRYRGFKRLIKDVGGRAAIKETKGYRLNSVWIGNIEVCYTEIKDDRDWIVEECWKPLGEDYE